MRQIKEIIIHCSATIEGKDYTVADIDRWHKARGWKGIGYHFVIYRDGSIHVGRAKSEAGAHCVGHNKISIGICYIGGLSKDGKAKDTRTPQQKDSLRSLIEQIREEYPKVRVLGHRDCSPDKNKDGRITKEEWVKQCPCFNVETEL